MCGQLSVDGRGFQIALEAGVSGTGITDRSGAAGLTRIRALTFLVLAAAACVAPASQAAGDDVLGAERQYTVRQGDTLYGIALENELGITELRAANPGVDPWLPPPRVEIVLPSAHILPSGPRDGIIINLGDQRLYLFGPEDEVMSFPIGIGHAGSATPVGSTTVIGKRENPTWFPPASLREADPLLPTAVPPGPANPLGRYALDLGWAEYVVHGTNRPYGIGLRISHGCVRLRNDDISRLYERVEVGTPVHVVDQPIKVGWSDGAVYLEVHPTQEQADEIADTGSFTFAGYGDLVSRVANAAADESSRVDWQLVRTTADKRLGIPVRITGNPST